MKKILTILFLTICTITFAQTPLVIKVSGSGSGGGNNDPDSLNGYAGGDYLRTVVANAAYKPITYVPHWADIPDKPTFATVATSGSYNDLSNQPTIPTKTSDLTNDVPFLTSASIAGKKDNSDSTGNAGYTTGYQNGLKANDTGVVHKANIETITGLKYFNGNLGVRGIQPFSSEDVGLWSSVKGAGGSGGVLRAGQFYSNYNGTNAFVAGDFYATDSTSTSNYDHVVSVQGFTNHLGSGTINNAWGAKMSGNNIGGNIANAYGYYWGGWTGSGTYTRKYSFYSTADTLFNGGAIIGSSKFAFGSFNTGLYQGLYNGINPVYEYQNSGVSTAFMGTGSLLFSGLNGNDFAIMQNDAARSLDFGVNGVIGIKVEKTASTFNTNVYDTYNHTINGNFYLTGRKQGSIFFTGGSGIITQDTTNLFWDNTNKKLGVGTPTPALTLTINGGAGNPATSGTTQTGIARFTNPYNADAIDFGVTSSSPTHVTWLQSVASTNLSINRAFSINPNGGNVLLGTLVDNGVDRLQVNGSVIASSFNLKASADLTGQTAAGTITTYTVLAADASFDVSGYINVTAISVDVLQFQVSYTDVSNTARTVTVGANLTTTGDYSFDLKEVRCKASTTITVKTNQLTGGGSESFYAGATITKIR